MGVLESVIYLVLATAWPRRKRFISPLETEADKRDKDWKCPVERPSHHSPNNRSYNPQASNFIQHDEQHGGAFECHGVPQISQPITLPMT